MFDKQEKPCQYLGIRRRTPISHPPMVAAMGEGLARSSAAEHEPLNSQVSHSFKRPKSLPWGLKRQLPIASFSCFSLSLLSVIRCDYASLSEVVSVRPSIPYYFRTTNMAGYEDTMTFNDVVINDDKAVASDVTPRYLFSSLGEFLS